VVDPRCRDRRAGRERTPQATEREGEGSGRDRLRQTAKRLYRRISDSPPVSVISVFIHALPCPVLSRPLHSSPVRTAAAHARRCGTVRHGRHPASASCPAAASDARGNVTLVQHTTGGCDGAGRRGPAVSFRSVAVKWIGERTNTYRSVPRHDWRVRLRLSVR
jgi:hypothetical protein